MKAFPVLALAYAVSVALIAPTWISAQEEPAPAGDDTAGVVAEPSPAPTGGTAPEVVSEGPAPEEPAQGEIVADEPQPEQQKADDPPVAIAAASGSVTIKDFEFSPSSVTVNVGDTVTWTNQGPSQHSATAGDGTFDTGLLPKGSSGSHTFTQAGTISYICTPHPFMKGTIVVKAAAAGTDDTIDDSTSTGDDASGSESADSADTTADTSGSSLPNTGGETLLIALLGLATLGSGLLLRRRAEG